MPVHSTTRNISNLIAVGIAMALLGTSGCAPQAQSESSTVINASPNADFQTVTIVKNLEHPWGMAWLPDGDLLITERPGGLRIVRDGVLDPNPIPGVPKVLARSQGGLLDIAVHPRFERMRYPSPPSA